MYEFGSVTVSFCYYSLTHYQIILLECSALQMFLLSSALEKLRILQNKILLGKGCVHPCCTKKSFLIVSGPNFDVL